MTALLGHEKTLELLRLLSTAPLKPIEVTVWKLGSLGVLFVFLVVLAWDQHSVIKKIKKGTYVDKKRRKIIDKLLEKYSVINIGKSYVYYLATPTDKSWKEKYICPTCLETSGKEIDLHPILISQKKQVGWRCVYCKKDFLY